MCTNRENSLEQTMETPNVSTNVRDTSQNTGNIGSTLQNVDIDTLIRSAVERELARFGINTNVNSAIAESTQSYSRVNNQSESNIRNNVDEVGRATHIIANHGNHDPTGSREHSCPRSTVLAKQTKIGPEKDNCHMATEMGLPRNGNKENYAVNENVRTPRNRIPEFLTGNPLHDTTNDVLNSTLITQDRTHRERESSITRLANAITSRLPTSNTTSLVKPVTTSTLTFDGKNEKFELFEDWFHTLIKMQPELTEAMKINQFHAHLRKDALQTFHNISSLNKNKLEDILIVFRRKYVKPESVATAKHKWHKLIFDPNRQSLPDFLEELHQGAEKAFGENANQMINSLLYAKLPPHLKRSINTAYLENGTYDEIVQHLERELELNGLEGENAPAITINSTQNSSNTTDNKPFNMADAECRYCKEKGHFVRECERLKRKKERDLRNGIPPVERRTYPPCEHCGLTNHTSDRCRRLNNNRQNNSQAKQ